MKPRKTKLPRYTPKLFVRGKLNTSDALHTYILKYPDSELARQYDDYFRERDRLKRKARRGDVKLQALRQYSNGGDMRCVRCGFSHPDALVLHGKPVEGKHGDDLYAYLKAQGWPRGYEVLCENCMFITTGRGGSYGLKVAVFRHYSPVGKGEVYSEEDGTGRYTCPKCGHVSFVLSMSECPRCGSALRQKVRCVSCDFSDIRALSLDHVDGKGAEHLRKLGVRNGPEWYEWLRDHDYPQWPRLQVLCMNCQFIKAYANLEW